MFYLIPLGACIFLSRSPAPLIVALLATLLIVIDYAASPSGGVPLLTQISQINRAFAVIVVWAFAIQIRAEASLPAEQQRMLRVTRSRESVFEKRRILLVEDDVRNVFAITRVLEPHGAILEIARNGREALTALERDPQIDLVLMDIMMPEMDGFEAMRAIRTQRRGASR